MRITVEEENTRDLENEEPNIKGLKNNSTHWEEDKSLRVEELHNRLWREYQRWFKKRRVEAKYDAMNRTEHRNQKVRMSALEWWNGGWEVEEGACEATR